MQRKELDITLLHPLATDLNLLAEHLEALRHRETVDKPVYDHSVGTISGTVPFGPASVIIVEGLHPFFTEKLRSLIDLKIFADPSRSVKRLWKLHRDAGDSGYRPEQIRYL